jgi:hypothetical protein
MATMTIIPRRRDRIAPIIDGDEQNAPTSHRKASGRCGGKPLQRPTQLPLPSIVRRSAEARLAHRARHVASTRPWRKQRP